jgi:hypothetical protein
MARTIPNSANLLASGKASTLAYTVLGADGTTVLQARVFGSMTELGSTAIYLGPAIVLSDETLSGFIRYDIDGSSPSVGTVVDMAPFEVMPESSGGGGSPAPLSLVADGGTVSSAQAATVTTFSAVGSDLSTVDGAYASVPQTVLWTSGAMQGLRFGISRYRVVGSDRFLTVSRMPLVPASGDTFVII